MESTLPSVGIVGKQGQQVSEQNEALRALNVDQFLKLMIAELQNQDPLSPKENTDILSQIGLMREIEASTQVLESSEKQLAASERLTSTLETMLFGQRLSGASALIGKEVGIQMQELLPEGIVEQIGLGISDPTKVGQLEGALRNEGVVVDFPAGLVTKQDAEEAMILAMAEKGVDVQRVTRERDTGLVQNGEAVFREVFDHFALSGNVDRVSIVDGVPRLLVAGRQIDMNDVREIIGE